MNIGLPRSKTGNNAQISKNLIPILEVMNASIICCINKHDDSGERVRAILTLLFILLVERVLFLVKSRHYVSDGGNYQGGYNQGGGNYRGGYNNFNQGNACHCRSNPFYRDNIFQGSNLGSHTC